MPEIVMQAGHQHMEQPYLLEEWDMPPRRDSGADVKRGRNSYTGQRLLDDDRKCLRLVELMLMGCGTRKIAGVLHSSREAVRAARAALEAQGRILPLKERVVRLLGEVIELGAEQYEAALENDLVPVATIPIAVGIFCDKRALMLHTPTAIEARVSAVASTFTADQWRTWVRAIPQAG